MPKSFSYTDSGLLVPTVIGNPTTRRQKSLNFYIDSGASKSVILRKVRDELELPLWDIVSVSTGAGRISMPAFRAQLTLLDKTSDILLLSPETPLPYDGLLGRDILDRYKICLDGKNRKIAFYDPGDKKLKVNKHRPHLH